MLMNRLGRRDLELPVPVALYTIGFAMKVKWSLRRRTWFWGLMAVITALHVPLILSIPWPGTWIPAVMLAPFMYVDFYAVIWIVAIVQEFMEGPRAPVK